MHWPQSRCRQKEATVLSKTACERSCASYLTLDKETIRRTRALAHCCVTYCKSCQADHRKLSSVRSLSDGLVDIATTRSSRCICQSGAKAGNVFAKTYTPKPGESRRTAILNARDLISGLRATFISSQSVDISLYER